MRARNKACLSIAVFVLAFTVVVAYQIRRLDVREAQQIRETRGILAGASDIASLLITVEPGRHGESSLERIGAEIERKLEVLEQATAKRLDQRDRVGRMRLLIRKAIGDLRQNPGTGAAGLASARELTAQIAKQEIVRLEGSALEPATRRDQILMVLGAGSLIVFGILAFGMVSAGARRRIRTRDNPSEGVIVTNPQEGAQMLRLQKLESLSALAVPLTHDLNNLLMGIVANATIMMQEAPPGSPILELGENVLSATEKAGRLTRQMLAYSGREKLAIQPLNLRTQVEEIASAIRASLPFGVRLRLNLPPDLPLIAADAAQIQQVVMNLVQNGADAIGLEGVVTISAGKRTLREGERTDNLGGAPLAPGPYLVLEVNDTGPGMDPATQARIFEPFFSTKPGGRGLGLAAVLNIVRGHRGGIAVVSGPGQGATFQVFFPFERESADASAIEAGRSASG